MKLNYTLTLDDYKAAQRLHLRRNLVRRLTFIFWYVVVPILAAAGALAGTPLVAEVVDYVPVYRTEAGTGGGWAFVRWQ